MMPIIHIKSELCEKIVFTTFLSFSVYLHIHLFVQNKV